MYATMLHRVTQYFGRVTDSEGFGGHAYINDIATFSRLEVKKLKTAVGPDKAQGLEATSNVTNTLITLI